jgi:hypothetical protein
MNDETFHIETFHIKIDPVLARLKRLPLRLRLAHLAALIRCGKVIVREGSLSYPSPRERERVVGREGRSEAEARVGGLFPAPPTPLLISFASTLPTAPRGEGLSADLAKPTFTDGGRAG